MANGRSTDCSLKTQLFWKDVNVANRPKAVGQHRAPIFRIAVARGRAEALDGRDGTGGELDRASGQSV